MAAPVVTVAAARARRLAPRHGPRRPGDPSPRGCLLGVLALVAAALAPLLLVVLVVVAFFAGGDDADLGPVPGGRCDVDRSHPAVADIVAATDDDTGADPLAAYQSACEASARYLPGGDGDGARRVDWAILAGIGKVECDHGRSPLPGCNPPGSVNPVGARGPMQFLGSTWRADATALDPDVAGPRVPPGAEAQGLATDGNGDGIADPWDWLDATHAAARFLVHLGLLEESVSGRERRPECHDDDPVRNALLGYNCSATYVENVIALAAGYRAAGDDSPAAPEVAAASAEPEAPGGLAAVSCPGGGSITVASSIAGPVQALLDRAAADGVPLCGSGFRDPQRQIELRRQHCGTSRFAVYDMPASQCSPPTARPGASMHERGLAVDFHSCASRSSACFRWLAANASDFGLFNLPSEPWHWSIDGT